MARIKDTSQKIPYYVSTILKNTTERNRSILALLNKTSSTDQKNVSLLKTRLTEWETLYKSININFKKVLKSYLTLKPNLDKKQLRIINKYIDEIIDIPLFLQGKYNTFDKNNPTGDKAKSAKYCFIAYENIIFYETKTKNTYQFETDVKATNFYYCFAESVEYNLNAKKYSEVENPKQFKKANGFLDEAITNLDEALALYQKKLTNLNLSCTEQSDLNDDVKLTIALLANLTELQKNTQEKEKAISTVLNNVTNSVSQIADMPSTMDEGSQGNKNQSRNKPVKRLLPNSFFSEYEKDQKKFLAKNNKQNLSAMQLESDETLSEEFLTEKVGLLKT